MFHGAPCFDSTESDDILPDEPDAGFALLSRRGLSGALDVMDESDLKFDWYDAWILAAVIWATEDDAPVPLWRLIGTADALNKAIVSRGELECGIGRLVRAGLICVAPDGFKAMPRALVLKAPGPPMEIVSKAIGAQEWSPQAEMPQTRGATYVSVDAYNKALRKYKKEFWKLYHQETE